MTAPSNIRFSRTGCWVDIDGKRFNIESKPAYLMCGAVFLSPSSTEDAGLADDLMSFRIGGEEWEAWGCPEPRLVELAIRYSAWLDNDQASPWRDVAVEPISESAAMLAVGAWIAKQPPDLI